MSRTFKFAFVVECASNGRADTDKVEELLDLALKDLIYDDSFIEALDESEAVTIQLIPIPESFEAPEA
jgi:hypothetical protein